MADLKWAITQLSRLLGLDDESAKQVLEYTSGLSSEAAAEHLKNMLGDSPQAIEFISTFNSRRGAPSASSAPASTINDGPAKAPRHGKKAKKPLSMPPPRQVEDFGQVQGAYQKKNLADDYMPAHKSRDLPLSSRGLSPTPAAVKQPTAATGTRASKPPPSAAGSLISDLPNVRSRNASPNPKAKTKVTVAGGTPMHGGSTVLNDLDSAIRSLELQTNPTTNQDPARACDCLATKHPLLNVAPNCLSCGKVICAKEGLGPCTFCSAPLLTQEQIQDMIRELREERGRERQNAHNVGQRKAEVAMAPRPFQRSDDASLSAAQAHRDKLLGFQAQNARRTRVHDEAADFETPSAGTNMWSSPVERAQQLKRQQKILREMEWDAKPEYEKRRTVVSVDLVGGKVVKRYGTAKESRPKEPQEEPQEEVEEQKHRTSAGAFGRNPLVGGLIKPVWKPDVDDESKGKEREGDGRTRSKWRRVQDDQDDNEELILDGGTYAGRGLDTYLGAEEPARG